jgi:hypothetical protein
MGVAGGGRARALPWPPLGSRRSRRRWRLGTTRAFVIEAAPLAVIEGGFTALLLLARELR